MSRKWNAYDERLWDKQPLPPERRLVLVQVAARPDGYPASVAVGYMKFCAGQEDSPMFVVPGVGGPVTHWSDSLGDDFDAPSWLYTQPKSRTEP